LGLAEIERHNVGGWILCRNIGDQSPAGENLDVLAGGLDKVPGLPGGEGRHPDIGHLFAQLEGPVYRVGQKALLASLQNHHCTHSFVKKKKKKAREKGLPIIVFTPAPTLQPCCG
jgi:hypothetical protein